MKRNMTLPAKGSVILLLIAMVAATPFLATAGGLVMVLDAVGLTGENAAGCAGNLAGAQMRSKVTCSDSSRLGERPFPKPGRERPLQFNFRRY
jgi:hypothetical protein